jgi:hypothetical protein
MGKYQVDKAIVFPIMPLSIKDPHALQNTKDQDFRNEWVITAIEKYPGKLFGALCVNPWKRGAMEEFEQEFRHGGIVCVKIHPMLHQFKLSDPVIGPIIGKASQLGLPIFIHSGPGASPAEIAELASRYPESTFIIGHMGGCIEYVFESIKACLDNKNLFIETSTILPAGVKFGVRILGAERFLFGSETPTGSHYAVELPKFDLIGLSKIEKGLILSENAVKLFDLSSRYHGVEGAKPI